MNIYNIIFGTIGVLGVILSIIFYIRSRKEKKPFYDIYCNTVIDRTHSSVDGIEIFYNAEQVHELSEILIAFYNKGKEVIVDNDKTEKDKIRVELLNGTILCNPEVLYLSNKSTNLSLIKSENKKVIFIDFDYLDSNDGIVFKFLVNSVNNNSIEFKGKIKGIPNLIDRRKKIEGLPITHSIINFLFGKFDFEPNLQIKIILFIIGTLLMPILFATAIIDILGMIFLSLVLKNTDIDIFKDEYSLSQYIS